MPRLSEITTAVSVVDAYIGVHFKLHAYVCGHGCSKEPPFEGYATFTLIFQKRPDGCRYAVASGVPVLGGLPDDNVLVWDLHDDSLSKVRQDGLMRPPAPIWQGTSIDGMIMKAMALYDRPQ